MIFGLNFARVSVVLGLVGLFATSPAHGFFEDYENYLVSYSFHFDGQVTEFDSATGKYIPVTRTFVLQRGQAVRLDAKTQTIIVRNFQGDEIKVPIRDIKGDNILNKLPNDEEKFKFAMGEPLEKENPDAQLSWDPKTNSKGQPLVAYADDPHALSQHAKTSEVYELEVKQKDSNGKPVVTLKDSAIVDLGSTEHPDYQLADRVCYQERGGGSKCAWTPADYVQQSGNPPPASANANFESSSFGELARRETKDDQALDEKDPYLDEDPPAPISEHRHVPKACPQDPFNRTKEAFSRLLFGIKGDLRSAIGMCPFSKTRPPNFNRDVRKNVYDAEALPFVKAHYPAAAAKKIKKDNGHTMTEQDFIDIDTLARTLYGEMETCATDIGQTEYMKGVARVILNRVADAQATRTDRAEKQEATRAIEYEGGPQSAQAVRKGDISKVVLSKLQFQMWNDVHHHNTPVTLEKVLCPPEPQDNSNAQVAWDNAVQVAMEAVLEPKKFKAETSAIKQRYYTSGIDMPNKSKKWVFVDHGRAEVINGKPLNDRSCIRFWDKKLRKP